MAVTNTKLPLTGLARRLVLDGVIPEQEAFSAFQHAMEKKLPLVAVLVERKLAKAAAIAHAATHEFGVSLLDIGAFDIDQDIIKLVKEDIIRRHHALPLFKRGNRLFVAVSDPTNLKALDEIRFSAGGVSTEQVLVEEDKLAKVIDSALEAATAKLDDMDDGEFENLDDLEIGGDEPEKGGDDTEIDDAPVVKFVNKVLLDAIKKGASDLHFEPYEKFYRVRFRVDGELSEITKPPLALSGKLAARMKVMARLDTSERRVPQDGRIKLKLSKNKSIDFRVSTCPTLFGEKVVMRILNSDASALSLDVLGYEDDQKKLFIDNIKKPYGMFLVTGPTGSGKTVSLYSGINLINTVDINISTAEDPVEINLPGVNQVQVDEKTGMTFERALKAFLRQDPDIILVGEIRDIITAGIAVKAAQTGHMVLATLHTNDAPQTLTRLVDMGVAPFAVATSINLITAQRLARKLCNTCKKQVEVPPAALKKEGFTDEQIATGFKPYQAVGCENCNNGYKGRTGLYQVMPISDAMKRLIMGGSNAIEIADQSRAEGIPDIRQSALKKVVDGVTSLEEINSVTME